MQEEMRKLDVCGMEELCRLESSEKTIAILGDRGWPQTAKQNGDRVANNFYVVYGRNVISAQIEVSLLRV